MVTNVVYFLISWTLSTLNALGKNNFDGILYSFLRLLRNNKTSWCPLVCRSRNIIITFYGSVSTCKIYEFFWFISSFSVIRILNENFSKIKYTKVCWNILNEKILQYSFWMTEVSVQLAFIIFLYLFSFIFV